MVESDILIGGIWMLILILKVLNLSEDGSHHLLEIHWLALLLYPGEHAPGQLSEVVHRHLHQQTSIKFNLRKNRCSRSGSVGYSIFWLPTKMFRSTDPDQGVKYQPNCKQKYFTLKTQSELLKKERLSKKFLFSGWILYTNNKKEEEK